jgi:uncharacterized protein involved in response to NO
MPVRIQVGSHQARSTGLALWQLGFRPFFLLAALFATLVIPLWLLVLGGRLQAPSVVLPAVWHAHEMLFGYTTAVLAGFLLTAVARWTGLRTAAGPSLMALAALWTLGRVAMSIPAVDPLLRAAIDVSFLPALAASIGLPIVRARNFRNLVVVGVVVLLAGANLLIHLDTLGVTPGMSRRALLLATNLVVFMMLLIGGRVIPMFTRNALRDDRIRSIPWLDRLSLGAMFCLMLLEVMGTGGLATSLVAAVTGMAVLARMRHWGTLASRRDAMLWVLHVGHGWIGAGLLCTALVPLWPALAASATHALTAGAIGTLTLGMMSRVSLGHTGRFIVSSRGLRAAFVLISAAAAIRVAAPLLGLDYLALLSVSGVIWSLAFATFLMDMGGKLLAPRPDGAPG